MARWGQRQRAALPTATQRFEARGKTPLAKARVRAHTRVALQELGASWEELDIPESLADQAAEYREKLIDAVVEVDDDVMMAYLDVSTLASLLLLSLLGPHLPLRAWICMGA